jgi:hypothetical protein
MIRRRIAGPDPSLASLFTEAMEGRGPYGEDNRLLIILPDTAEIRNWAYVMLRIVFREICVVWTGCFLDNASMNRPAEEVFADETERIIAIDFSPVHPVDRLMHFTTWDLQ